jgi:hypothetical protein
MTEVPASGWGTPEHAAAVTDGRQPGIRDGLQWLTYSHLPEQLRKYSEPFYFAAVSIIAACPTDSPELTTAINCIISAKDSSVRAGIRNDTGRAGSVPRPQKVVEPPHLTGEVAATCSHGVSRDVSPQGWASAHVTGYCGDPDPV